MFGRKLQLFSEELESKETPITAYEKLKTENSFLFESPGHEKLNQFSFIGFDPFLIFKSKGRKIQLNEKGTTGNPINELKKLFNSMKIKTKKGLPPFQCGAAGYLGYDMVHFFEKLPKNARDDTNIPDSCFLFVDKLVAFDHKRSKVFLISVAENNSSGTDKLENIRKKLDTRPRQRKFSANLKLLSPLISNFTKEQYIEAVKKVKEYIYAGDTFQVNISQRFSIDAEADPFEIYKKLTWINPSPFSAFLNLEDVKLISCSPERLVKLAGRRVETRPIAGTMRRGKTTEEDKILEEELLSNEKELAEHTMLVDLQRNDIGKVCEYGSVKVDEKHVVEKYSHVMHLVSKVTGKLHETKDVFDLIRAVFPGGTITGCPKVRTMEIIDEIEPVRRGPYTGSIGYLSFTGDADFNMIIRTLVNHDRTYHIQAGGGIVADSDPEKEYEETLHKARALFKAIGINLFT